MPGHPHPTHPRTVGGGVSWISSQPDGERRGWGALGRRGTKAAAASLAAEAGRPLTDMAAVPARGARGRARQSHCPRPARPQRPSNRAVRREGPRGGSLVRAGKELRWGGRPCGMRADRLTNGPRPPPTFPPPPAGLGRAHARRRPPMCRRGPDKWTCGQQAPREFGGGAGGSAAATRGCRGTPPATRQSVAGLAAARRRACRRRRWDPPRAGADGGGAEWTAGGGTSQTALVNRKAVLPAASREHPPPAIGAVLGHCGRWVDSMAARVGGDGGARTTRRTNPHSRSERALFFLGVPTSILLGGDPPFFSTEQSRTTHTSPEWAPPEPPASQPVSPSTQHVPTKKAHTGARVCGGHDADEQWKGTSGGGEAAAPPLAWDQGARYAATPPRAGQPGGGCHHEPWHGQSRRPARQAGRLPRRTGSASPPTTRLGGRRWSRGSILDRRPGGEARSDCPGRPHLTHTE